MVLASGRTLYTPPTDAGILPGTTQQTLFRVAAQAGWNCEVRAVPVGELGTAGAVWLASSVRLLARVHTLDGQPRGDATTAADLTQELLALLA